MLILDLCGGTGAWSKPYRDAGYDTLIVDMADDLPDLDFHRARMTVEDFLVFWEPVPVQGVLCAPECTHFAGSGAQYWAAKDADGRTAQAVAMVRTCLAIIDKAKPAWWAMENPVGRLPKLVPELGPPRMYFNPCDYGDAYTKKTCLWGSFTIPEKSPVEPVMYTTSTGKRGSMHWAKLGGKSKRTKRLRSVTPSGFANAFFRANP
jgi:hypothetical protein